MPEQTRRFIFVSEAIVFTSGKGGVGKTTVISNIGVELSQSYIISAKYVNKQATKEAYPQSFLFATHKAKG